jgi:hypothetical protein
MCVRDSIYTDILIGKSGIKITLSIFYHHAYVDGEYDIAYRTKCVTLSPFLSTSGKTATEIGITSIIKTELHSRYEGESLNRSQMHIKHKICVIRTWKEHLFLDISSTNTDTLVPLLYQCVKTSSIEVF